MICNFVQDSKFLSQHFQANKCSKQQNLFLLYFETIKNKIRINNATAPVVTIIRVALLIAMFMCIPSGRDPTLKFSFSSSEAGLSKVFSSFVYLLYTYLQQLTTA